jgi:LysR family transcriptional regulator, glycine cleavage system transcriptional activator
MKSVATPPVATPKPRVPLAWRSRPLNVGGLRAFCAVASRLNFRAAAEDLSSTQSAVSRQIQALEESIGVSLFLRHTRSVELTQAGAHLLSAVAPSLERIDSAVMQVRSRSGRQSVTLTTFASFAALWLIPRLHGFQTEHPAIDLRIDTNDQTIDLESSDIDLALRYGPSDSMPPGAQRLFGEQLALVASPSLLKSTTTGAKSHSLGKPADLKHFALIEDIGHVGAQLEWLTWRRWLNAFSQSTLEPKRWLYLSYTHQMIQAAVAGQGIALARTPLVAEYLASGQLIEPLKNTRVESPMAYWLVLNRKARASAEVAVFVHWLGKQSFATRKEIGDGPDSDTLTGSLDD